MQRFVPILILGILCLTFPAVGRQKNAEQLKQRQESIDWILRLQDLRTLNDGKLIEYLSDHDPAVRERATLAYGSIQDTAALPLLIENLVNAPPNVERAAAFAIGQTAGLLSRKAKQQFEHDLIWVRMDKTKAIDRLMEEIGKFGTEQALEDLLQRFGNTAPYSEALVMSIARFAIRGVTSPAAVQYLLRFIRPVENTPWQVVYALQRIGDHADVRNNLEEIVQLYRHPKALARMHLATLLGKIKDPRPSLEPLLKLAEFDGDWRVRVNALKALGNIPLTGQESAIDAFRRAFTNGNPYIALTAITSAGLADFGNDTSSHALKEVIAALKAIAQNKGNGHPWQMQAEAAVSLAKILGRGAFPFVQPTDLPQPLLQADLLRACGLTGSPEAYDIISPYLGNEKSIFYRGAIDALFELSQKNLGNKSIVDQTYAAAITALKSRDVAVLTTAVSLLGDSLFLRASSVKPLVELLGNLRVPDDVEALQEVASTLGKLKDPSAVSALVDMLGQRDLSVAQAAASALKSITGKSYAGEIRRGYEPLFTDLDFTYLHSLPETVKVKLETIRGTVTMELFKNVAPFTVMSFLKLATQRGFYRGLPFHRVVPNFVVQGGDRRGDGWGGPGYSIRSEFSPLTYEAGMVGMASSGKDTEGSQFFITQSPQPHLDGRYTIFGKVIGGMDVVDKIQVDDHIYDITILR